MEQSNFSKHTNTNWRFRREQAQADINRFVGYLKHYEDVNPFIHRTRGPVGALFVSLLHMTQKLAKKMNFEHLRVA